MELKKSGDSNTNLYSLHKRKQIIGIRNIKLESFESFVWIYRKEVLSFYVALLFVVICNAEETFTVQ